MLKCGGMHIEKCNFHLMKRPTVLMNSKKCRIKLSISQDDFDIHDDKYMLAKIISYESKFKIIP